MLWQVFKHFAIFIAELLKCQSALRKNRMTGMSEGRFANGGLGCAVDDGGGHRSVSHHYPEMYSEHSPEGVLPVHHKDNSGQCLCRSGLVSQRVFVRRVWHTGRGRDLRPVVMVAGVAH